MGARKIGEKLLLEQKFDQVTWTVKQTFTGILVTLIPWIALSLGLTLVNTSGPNIKLSPQLDLTNAIIIFFFSTLVEGAFLLAPFYYARRTSRLPEALDRSPRQLLGLRRFDVWKALGLVVAFFVAIYLLNIGYSWLITILHLHVQTNDAVLLQEGKNAPLTTYAVLLVGAVVAPFCEEIFFRGFVFMGLLRGMSPAWAIVFSALIFGVAHGDPGSFLVLFLIGLALAFLRWHTHSIWPGILLHMLNNTIGALLIVLAMHGINV